MDKDSVESLEQHLDLLIETSRQIGKHLLNIKIIYIYIKVQKIKV